MADNKSCEVIGGKRMCGKTSELIRMAFREQLYILCADKRMAKIIYEQAKEMDLEIPYPITPDDLPLRNPCINRVLIDEVEILLQRLIGKRVSAMSTSYQLRELPEPNESGNKSKSVGSITIDVDFNDALTGLKAIQREARKATAALKDLETKATETTIKVSYPSDVKEES
ncbi:hypothetical protein [Oceanobacillus neutriphilus]|uniref:AAA domain-containing protein n=1 Tax=Oceanobacillus neutriphilus TaxID=531815 RepID=A0ABQ2P3A0_9BACI|nr:hypothetical protein [Oceanobacillus neutriphilus]GGP17217.1 hypothetical protein GCM10011346_52230 [Oceanobacillus neutriphilus]